jgi:SAM-dependent methyltransferase
MMSGISQEKVQLSAQRATPQTHAGTAFLRKFKRGVQRHGVIGLLGVAAGRVLSIVHKMRPSVRAEIRERARRAHDFDARFGVDTGGFIHPTDLALDQPNQLHAVSYRGSDPKYFNDAIASLPIDYARFVFVDFGSGKGRVLLLAQQFPFKRIIGVEFSKELHRIAEENIRRFPKGLHKAQTVESICLDATEFALPEEPLVCYFCNPFDAVIMEEMVRRIERSLSCNPRDLFVVYYNPKEAHVFAKIGLFALCEKIGPICVWRARVTEGVRRC